MGEVFPNRPEEPRRSDSLLRYLPIAVNCSRPTPHAYRNLPKCLTVRMDESPEQHFRLWSAASSNLSCGHSVVQPYGRSTSASTTRLRLPMA
jgi:hypothetical protein